MKIQKKDLKSGTISVQIENLDDLWFLSQIIDAGDVVKGSTQRKIKVGDENNPTIIRKWVCLSLSVEKVDFSVASSWLRLTGPIIEGPEDIPRGAYHTINVDQGTSISIIKKQWLQYQLQKLEEAANTNQSRILIVVFDREEATFALTGRRGYDILLELSGDVSKKDMDNQGKGSFFKDIARSIMEYCSRFSVMSIVIACSSIWKDYISRELDPSVLDCAIFASVNMTGKAGIDEVLKRPELGAALKDERTAQEMILVEKILSGIAVGGLVAYGIKEVEEAAEVGAVECILVTDTLLRTMRESGTFDRLESIMKLVDQMKGDVHMISGEHDGGKQLDGIGGIASLLRYRLS